MVRARDLVFFSALATSLAATAQSTPGADVKPAAIEARQRFERQVEACNKANLPDPARESCVREAGLALDRALGGPPASVPVATPDGRAVVVSPAGSLPPASKAEPTTTPDGRATVVRPTDGGAAR